MRAVSRLTSVHGHQPTDHSQYWLQDGKEGVRPAGGRPVPYCGRYCGGDCAEPGRGDGSTCPCRGGQAAGGLAAGGRAQGSGRAHTSQWRHRGDQSYVAAGATHRRQHGGRGQDRSREHHRHRPRGGVACARQRARDGRQGRRRLSLRSTARGGGRAHACRERSAVATGAARLPARRRRPPRALPPGAARALARRRRATARAGGSNPW